MAFRFVCGHCNVTSVTRVIAYKSKMYSDIDWRPYCFVVCDNCQKGSLISFHLNSGYVHNFKDFEKNTEIIDVSICRDLEVYPEHKLEIPPNLPNILADVYSDAEFNFQSKRWKAAAQLYLQALEFACLTIKTGGDETAAELDSSVKSDLTKRINDLSNNGLISNNLKEWAHQIRVIGQYHKHRYVEADHDDCIDIRTFVDMFMRYAITMPAEIAKRRQRMKG